MISFLNNLYTYKKEPAGRVPSLMLAISLNLVTLLAIQAPALCFTGYGGGPERSLRSPLIPGASHAYPFECPPEGQPPPLGDGWCPDPVTSGQMGMPVPAPASHVCLPPVGPMDKPLVDAMLAPYLEPPPSTPGFDHGMLCGPLNGYYPPAVETRINPGGGISGSAPTERWGGQTTRDLGERRTFGSQLTDFGQDIDNIARVRRSNCFDGPRRGAPNRPRAQTTQDLHGNRTMFKGAGNRPVMTIADY